MESRSFWQRPEGKTGALVFAGLAAGLVFVLIQYLPVLIGLLQNTLYLAGLMAALALVVYIVLDPKTRNLFWYFYKSVMRWVTGLFIQIDPIAILKTHIEGLEQNLRKLSKQIGALRGQMRQLKGTMDGNAAEIQKNMALAERAKKQNDEKSLSLAARKAGRLQEANAKYEELYRKMEILYRLLTKMYEDSEIVLEDTKDQVNLKEQEYQAIQASHTAIRSAMSILSGNPDQRAVFDQALEHMADEVSQKVGDMERFMVTSRNLMDSIDLQNGVFEEEGLRLLEQLDKQSPLRNKPGKQADPALDLNKPPKEAMKDPGDYSKFFE